MIEILLSLGGVIIGGVIGLGGTHLQTKNQKHIRQREEVLPVAGKALAAAEEAYQAIGEYDRVWNRAERSTDPTMPTPREVAAQHNQSYHKLQVALNELSLLMRGIEDESKQLRETVSIWNAGDPHPWKSQNTYDQARDEFIERVREFLGT